MENGPILNLLLDLILFLELSDAKTIDEDSTVEMLEHVSATLQNMDIAVKERFQQLTKHRARLATSSAERETLDTLATNLGLTSE